VELAIEQETLKNYFPMAEQLVSCTFILLSNLMVIFIYTKSVTMKVLLKIVGLLFLLPLMSCTQTKRQYGPDEYLYMVRTESDKYGYKDKDGNMAIPLGKYHMVFTDTIKTIGFVSGKGGTWAINKQDEKLFLTVPSPNNGPDEVNDGLVRMRDENDLIGFANIDGEIVISPRFADVHPFVNGLASFCKGCEIGRYKTVQTEQYRIDQMRVMRAHGDTILLDKNTKWGKINKLGDTIIPPVYDRIYPFIDGIALAFRDGRAFYIDPSGSEVQYEPKKHPNQKPLDPDINNRLKYIDGWESLLEH